MIAGVHFDFASVVEAEPGCTLKDNHPFTLVLIIPKTIWTSVSGGDNSFDPNIATMREDLNEFTGE